MSIYTFRFKAIENVTKVNAKIERSFLGMDRRAGIFQRKVNLLPRTINRVDKETKELSRTQKRSFIRTPIKRYNSLLNRTTRNQQKFNHVAGKSSGVISGFLGTVNRFLPVAAAGYAVRELTIGTAMLGDKMKIANNTILQISGSQQGLNRAQSIARGLMNKTGDGYEEMLFGLSKMLPLAKGNVEQAGNLVTLASALQGIDSEQGFAGALFALKELESGDTMSLRERFGIRVPTQSEAKKIAEKDGKTVQAVMFDALQNYLDTTYGQGEQGAGVEFLLKLNADTIGGQAKRTMNILKGIIIPGVEDMNKPIVSLFKRFNSFLSENIEPARNVLKGYWRTVKPIFSGVFIGLREIAQSVSKVWSRAQEGGFVMSIFNRWGKTIEALGMGLAAAGKLIGFLLERTVKVGNDIIWVKNQFFDFFSSVGTSAKQFIERNNPFSFMIDLVDNVIPGFRTAMSGLWGWLKGVFSRFMNWFNRVVIRPISDFFKPVITLNNPLDVFDLKKGVEENGRHKFNFLDNVTGGNKKSGHLPAGSSSGIGFNRAADKVISSGGSVKNINITIGKLNENIVFNNTTLAQSKEVIREEITKLLLDVVNDVNYAN